MCVTYCHRRGVVYWNHDDCSYLVCPLVAESHGRCASCRHRQEDACALTHAPLPAEGGCCHWNVEPAQSQTMVTLDMLAPLGVEANETVAEVLDSLSTPYHVDAQGQPWIDPGRLGLPFSYGLGTESEPETGADWDWSEWEAIWQEREECAAPKVSGGW